MATGFFIVSTHLYVFLFFRMGFLDFDIVSVTSENLKEREWDSIVLVSENLNWQSPASELSHLKSAIEDALKVLDTSNSMHLDFIRKDFNQQNKLPLAEQHPLQS